MREGALATQSSADLGDDRRRALIDIGRRVAQHDVSGLDQQVLTADVVPVPFRAAVHGSVELDDHPIDPQVRPGEKPTMLVTDGR